MKTIDLEMIDLAGDNSFFHFSPKKFEAEIEQQGLQPRIGENSRGGESIPKVFVSRSGEGVLSMVHAFIRKTMWNVDESIDGKVPGYPHIVDKKNEKSIKDCIFYMVREYFKKCNYYSILNVQRTNMSDYLYMTREEREIIDFVDNDVHDSGAKMSKANSHLLNGKKISPERVRKVTIQDNYNTNALEIIMRIIEKNKEQRFFYEPIDVFCSEELNKNMTVKDDGQYRTIEIHNGDRAYFADSNDAVFFYKEDGTKVIIGSAETSWIDEFYDYCKEREKKENYVEI